MVGKLFDLALTCTCLAILDDSLAAAWGATQLLAPPNVAAAAALLLSLGR